MKIIYTTGSFTIPASSYPDSPLSITQIDASSSVRDLGGGIYSPASFSVKQYNFSFTNIQPAILGSFITLWGSYSAFTIESLGLLGTLNVIMVPGSFNIAYDTYRVVSCSFAVQDEEAT